MSEESRLYNIYVIKPQTNGMEMKEEKTLKEDIFEAFFVRIDVL